MLLSILKSTGEITKIVKKIIRRYSELIKLHTFEERLEYVKILDGKVGHETFGFDRYLNQQFYASQEWKRFRNYIITRDFGCDLAFKDYEIPDKIIIHHLNPLIPDDIIQHSDNLFDPENVVCVCDRTHRYIHYGTFETIPKKELVERRPNDQTPWRNV